MKTVTIKTEAEFDALLSHLAGRLSTTRSRVIRDAVKNYGSIYGPPRSKHEHRHSKRQKNLILPPLMVYKRGGVYLANF